MTRRSLVAAAGLAIVTASRSSAAQTVGLANGVTAPSGLLTVDSDTTVVGSLTLAPGTRIVVHQHATLTLLGDLIAPAERIFFGDGRVDLHASRLIAVLPEWWGAIANDATVDSCPAITAAMAAHPATQLGLGDYHLFDVLRVNQTNRRLWGIGRTSNAEGTRLVSHRSDGPVIVAGSAEAPASINDYVRGIDIRSIELARSAPPRLTLVDDPLVPTGLAIRYVLDSVFEDVRSNEHTIGYSIRGAVRTFLRDCTAFRSIFSDSDTDNFIGFDMDGRQPSISTGANASLYLVDCNARTGNRPVRTPSIGCRILGAFSDTFLTRFETTELANGIVVDGAMIDANLHPFGQLDVHIDMPVLDQCTSTCIAIANLSRRAMIDIHSPWFAVAATGDTALCMTDCGGATTIVGGQFVGSSNANRAMVLIRASGVALQGAKMMGFARAVEVIDSDGFDLAMAIVASREDCAIAMSFTGCHNGFLRPRLPGGLPKECVGVAIDGCSEILLETYGLSAAVVKVDGRSVSAFGKPFIALSHLGSMV